jgi:hypothetical protein
VGKARRQRTSKRKGLAPAAFELRLSDKESRQAGAAARTVPQPAEVLVIAGGVDTVKSGHWYMVRDSVWRCAVPNRGEILCMQCLEWRLGRPLVPADFLFIPGELQRR